MKIRSLALLAALSLSAARGGEVPVLFDFDSAPQYSPLPITLTVGGITAHFSATGQGFSIQAANALGFTPAGFAGLCIYPSSIYLADLLVSFDRPLTAFSILYAPEEYACDSSATMLVSAYLGGTLVGTNTMVADPPGTWPSATLAFSTNQPFDHVVVHYLYGPPTGGDYGAVFMADNMWVTPAPPPIVLTSPTVLANGAFQLGFTNTPGGVFSVFGTTNPALPFASWSLLGNPTEITAGQYQFIDLGATNLAQRFYRVSSP